MNKEQKVIKKLQEHQYREMKKSLDTLSSELKKEKI